MEGPSPIALNQQIAKSALCWLISTGCDSVRPLYDLTAMYRHDNKLDLTCSACYMQDLTGFQRDLLYVISGADQPSGQDVKEEIEQYYSSEINHGRLYPNLDTVVNKDFVEKGQLDRRTNYYAITDEGEQTIEERQAWESQFLD